MDEKKNKEKSFRDYSSCNESVKECYRKQREYQYYEKTKQLQEKYCTFERKDSFWNLFDRLNIIDNSDPDINLSNHHHLFQTAEGIRKAGHPKWMQLVGLVHDLGKIMYLFGNDKDGTSEKEQWALVGDTFITGCKIPDTIVFPEFNSLNKDHLRYDTMGIYNEPNQGLHSTQCSFGHDEYLYRMLRYNNIKLPEEAYYMIRYHSLYLWHDKGEYSYFENDMDRKMKPWVQLFNQYDLYTKTDIKQDWNSIRVYYERLVDDYFPNMLRF